MLSIILLRVIIKNYEYTTDCTTGFPGKKHQGWAYRQHSSQSLVNRIRCLCAVLGSCRVNDLAYLGLKPCGQIHSVISVPWPRVSTSRLPAKEKNHLQRTRKCLSPTRGIWVITRDFLLSRFWTLKTNNVVRPSIRHCSFITGISGGLFKRPFPHPVRPKGVAFLRWPQKTFTPDSGEGVNQMNIIKMSWLSAYAFSFAFWSAAVWITL
jgi:hypothetical protein